MPIDLSDPALKFDEPAQVPGKITAGAPTPQSVGNQAIDLTDNALKFNDPGAKPPLSKTDDVNATKRASLSSSLSSILPQGAADTLAGLVHPNESSDMQDMIQRGKETSARGDASLGLAVGGEGLAGAVSGVSKWAQAGWQARKAAILAEQAAKINAAQDAAHIAQVAEAVAPRSWSAVGSKINSFLKEDAAAEAQRGATAGESAGANGPRWPSNQPPPAPTDVTAADLARKAAEAAAGQSTRTLLKNPAFWATLAGTGAGVGGAGIWSAMSTTYHARALIRNLSHIFGE